ncbi:glycosyltransferase family 2 protein [Flavobacteriaceae bacterium]|nr:glycosyltransferase family 2 protein [Flavobacteriaceae bacterium]MDC0622852.1 glycosyltransferase family 2 protein [Flavobacteriaceae bacterium]
MDISIVIPLLNECESLQELSLKIDSVMKENSFSYEVIYVDDGSNDNSWEIISSICKKNSSFKAIKFSKNYGKSQALHAGFEIATGNIVFTMDADLQDDPKEIPEMYNLIINKNLDILSGWKKKRFDPVLTKNLPSKVFNLCARLTSGIKLNDFNCGLKGYKNEVIKNINVYGEMHRYIPILASNEGYNKIEEKVIKHRPRKYGQTKFGMSRFSHGFLDLVTIWFLSRFGKRPMHFFGTIGALMLIIGFMFAIYLGVDKVYLNPDGRLITERPEFFISLTTMILGSQFFVAGFLGEMITRNNQTKKQYKIDQTINN